MRVSVTGRPGELPIVGLDHEATSFSLTFVVTGATPAGTDGGFQQMEANLEALSALLGTRNRLMSLRYQAGSIVRIADVTITAASEPEIWVGAARARFSVVVEVPGVYWRDEAEATWQGSVTAPDQVVTTLAGSTAPITDALIRVTGPATNFTLTDMASGGSIGMTVFLANVIPEGQRLLIDAAAQRAALVGTDTWDLDGGTDRTGAMVVSGPGSATRWIHLTPAIALGDPFSRAVIVSCSATATTSESAVEIRARRAYL
ncbi:hypothetical protein ACFMQL_20575 [Nonomuraea fastidiosa]|uniref:hypothetical protein n=1 Tax=Nonomuraea fastidiosa TaxID=46173 RepID=UPI003670C55E